jgi:hypothetical protein
MLTATGDVRSAIHDVRNLLLAIEAQAFAILERLDPMHPARPGIGAISSSSRRATTSLERLRIAERRPATDMATDTATETSRRVTDVAAVLEGLEPVLREGIGDLASLTIRVPATPAIVDAQPAEVEQAVSDLIVVIADALYHPGIVRVGMRVVALPSEPGVGHRRVVEIEVLSDGRRLTDAETDVVRESIESFGGRLLIEQHIAGGSSVKLLLPARA